MINKSIWLAIDQQTKEKIAKDFELRRSGETEVVDNRVISDGYTDQDLMAITEEGLNERLKKTQNTLPQGFMKKWEYYVSDMRGDEVRYSNNEGLNKGLKLSLDNLNEAKEKAKEIIKAIENKPKKGGRPKGSKNKRSVKK
jgi:hypothetical protein